MKTKSETRREAAQRADGTAPYHLEFVAGRLKANAGLILDNLTDEELRTVIECYIRARVGKREPVAN